MSSMRGLVAKDSRFSDHHSLSVTAALSVASFEGSCHHMLPRAGPKS